MKKIMALILTFVFVAALGINALALEEAPPPQHYDIPKATPGFTIGDFDLAKWNGALFFDYNTSNCWPAMDGDNNPFLGAKMYFAWADEGIYFYADVKNPNDRTISAPAIDEAHNKGTGLQFFPATEATNDMVGWTFSPYTTPDGKADVWRHWPDEDNDKDCQIFVKLDANGKDYIMEGLMSSKSFAVGNGFAATIAEGLTFGMSTVFLQSPEEGSHYGWTDTAWFNLDEYTTYTLVGRVIEGAPPPAPEPEPAAPEPEPAAPAPAPAEPAPAPAAPVTGDTALIMFAAAFILSAAFILTKRAAKTKT